MKGKKNGKLLMTDELLEAKELRVQDALRKLTWFMEEYQELQLSPALSDYLRIARKASEDWTPEEKCRRQIFRATDAWRQLHFNQNNRVESRKELRAALDDLKEYRRNNIIRPKLINKQQAAASDGKHHFLPVLLSQLFIVFAA